MIYCFSKSHMGYSHKNSLKPCQDNSFHYQDKNRTIIATCDGHGGDIYIRSKIGSYLACRAIFNVFIRLNLQDVNKYSDPNNVNKLKLAILCEWNKMVESHLSHHPIRKKELTHLSSDDIETLLHNKIKAYGTTLAGALYINKKILLISIGDSEVFSVRKGEISKVFEDNNEPVANITYSMCQEDAFNYLQVKVLDTKDIDGVIMCTDGVSSPYQSYDNFNQSFVKPLMNKILLESNYNYINDFISLLGDKLGNGDDVSLAFIINSKASKKYYR